MKITGLRLAAALVVVAFVAMRSALKYQVETVSTEDG